MKTHAEVYFTDDVTSDVMVFFDTECGNEVATIGIHEGRLAVAIDISHLDHEGTQDWLDGFKARLERELDGQSDFELAVTMSS